VGRRGISEKIGRKEGRGVAVFEKRNALLPEKKKKRIFEKHKK